MLIINADDLGRDKDASDTCLACFAAGAVTSASLMVFMADSERAAAGAREAGLETGLHLNLTQLYSAPQVEEGLRRSQAAVVRYLRRGKWAQVVYNPFVGREVGSAFRAQLDEYRRLLGADPAHVNGHNHMHLSMNMLLAAPIPEGFAVRRSFTFRRGEKGALNRLFRRAVDRWVERRYRTTDAFYSLDPVSDGARRARIIDRARTEDVELMVHAWRPDQLELLRSGEFRSSIAAVPRGAFSLLTRTDRRR